MSTYRRTKIDPYLSPCAKLKSKGIKNLSIKPDTLNLIVEKVGNSIECIGTGGHFLNRIPIAQTLRPTIDKWTSRETENFCMAKDTAHRTKRKPTDWGEKKTLSTLLLIED